MHYQSIAEELAAKVGGVPSFEFSMNGKGAKVPNG